MRETLLQGKNEPGYTQERLGLHNFIHQYQTNRHLINLAPQNALSLVDAFREVKKSG
jgi:hypothetical protein